MASKKKKKQAKKAEKAALNSSIKKGSLQKAKTTRPPSYLFSIFGILLFTCLVFSSSIKNEYVNWDDDKNFYENEQITTITQSNFWENTREIFSGHVIGNYNPLTIFTFALEQRFVDKENRPTARHINNLLLHLVCVWFVFWIGMKLGLGLYGSSFLALLFAIHPMRVESVAWVTERKDVLFGAFYFAALYYYIKGCKRGMSLGTHLFVFTLFVLSLFSKVQAVLLPVSMVLVDYYLSKDNKITLKSLLSKAPYFIASLLMGLKNIQTLAEQGSVSEQAYSGLSRIFIGSYSLAIYYVKALIPYRLSPLYPYPPSLDWTFYASIVTFAITAGLLLWAYLQKKKVLFFGLGFFIANVFLLLQILGAGQGFLADRFTYVPYFGLFFIMAWYFHHYIKEKPNLKTPLFAAAAVLALGYSYITYNQNKIWKNSGTLWTHVLKYYNKSTLPWGNRANYYRDSGLTSQALNDYGEVIRLAPEKSEAYNSRARLFFNTQSKDSLLMALENYNLAIERKPGDVEYRVNRGATYARLGDGQSAINELNEAEKLDPTFANIYLNRSVINNQNGNSRAALADIDKYLAIKKNFPDMWYEKARIHNGIGEGQQGMAAITNALKLNSRKGIYYFERAKSNFMLQNFDAAKQDIKTSQSLGHRGDPKVVNQILGN